MQFLQFPCLNVFSEHCSSQEIKLSNVVVILALFWLPIVFVSVELMSIELEVKAEILIVELEVGDEMIVVELGYKVELVKFALVVVEVSVLIELKINEVEVDTEDASLIVNG